MSELVTFEAALEATQERDKSLLLGNGFAVSQTKGKFSYKNLLEVSSLKKGENPREVFTTLETVDFELVIDRLESSSRISQHYEEKQFSQNLQLHSQAVRKALVDAIKKVHPASYASIETESWDRCSEFLSHFSQVFTLNYDLLLYWASLHSKKFSDGFGLGDTIGRFRKPFKEGADCTIHYLHGGLHLYLDKKLVAEKIVNQGNNLLDAIEEEIVANKRYPLFVAEGTTEEKLAKVRSVPYLNCCLERLSKLKGVLFVYGHSADERDGHIYDALCKSGVGEIYFFVYDPGKNLIDAKKKLAKYKEVKPGLKIHYLDAAAVTIW
jgi:hypothetical protein